MANARTVAGEGLTGTDGITHAPPWHGTGEALGLTAAHTRGERLERADSEQVWHWAKLRLRDGSGLGTARASAWLRRMRLRRMRLRRMRLRLTPSTAPAQAEDEH
ncbi:hypothetical protein GCM10023334_009520 [Nonomuraea thailandensis]